MQKLFGYISKDYNGWATIGDVPFVSLMNEFAKEHGINYFHFSLYISREKMGLDMLQEKFLHKILKLSGLEDSRVYEKENDDVGHIGYTIEESNLYEFSTILRDVDQVLLENIGKYANIKIEVLSGKK